ncbi:MAG: phosphoenolpyruvate--protein phosphotransferase [candidate division Zixibacteria bacterium]|nr:phosphoenolpyruvate--protein phosphotransferase [candidate division Zixibacteria bacterium]
MHESQETILKGQPITPGIAIGKFLVLEQKRHSIGPHFIHSSLTQQELEKFRQALAAAKQEILQVKQTVSRDLDPKHIQIFEVQAMLLDDPEVNGAVEHEIKENCKSATLAYREVIEKNIASLFKSNNQYLKERIADIQALKSRVLEKLSGQKFQPVMNLQAPAVVLSNSISPAELVQLNRKNILGLGVKEAGVTSHVALLSKAFNIPTVVGWETELKLEQLSGQAIVDGNSGKLILFPQPDTLELYQKKKERWDRQIQKVKNSADLPALTKDKTKINLLANLDLPEEADLAISRGADGVGLFRTEFMFLVAPGFPTEEEQFKVYSILLEKFNPLPVTVRTLDLGGDKLFGPGQEEREANPFLGWRAIRVCLDFPDLFKTQLRALLRASVKGTLKIMIPMVAQPEEITRTLQLLKQVKSDLRRKKQPFSRKIEIGIMIEIPSAALTAETLAKQVDFFSLGTNDLTQYTLAVDRGNRKISNLFDELDPAVLKLIQMTVQAARKHKIEVAICGEMAAWNLALPALLGLGLRTFSVAPSHIAEVKSVLAKISLSRARQATNKIMKMKTRGEIKTELKKLIR